MNFLGVAAQLGMSTQAAVKLLGLHFVTPLFLYKLSFIPALFFLNYVFAIPMLKCWGLHLLTSVVMQHSLYLLLIVMCACHMASAFLPLKDNDNCYLLFEQPSSHQSP